MASQQETSNSEFRVWVQTLKDVEDTPDSFYAALEAQGIKTVKSLVRGYAETEFRDEVTKAVYDALPEQGRTRAILGAVREVYVQAQMYR